MGFFCVELWSFGWMHYDVHIFWKKVKNVNVSIVPRTVRSEINGTYSNTRVARLRSQTRVPSVLAASTGASVVYCRYGPLLNHRITFGSTVDRSLRRLTFVRVLGSNFHQTKQNRHFLVVFPEVWGVFIFKSTEYSTSPGQIYFSSLYARKLVVRLLQDWRTGSSKCCSFPVGQVGGGGGIYRRMVSTVIIIAALPFWWVLLA